jgi:hypothetical protein
LALDQRLGAAVALDQPALEGVEGRRDIFHLPDF